MLRFVVVGFLGTLLAGAFALGANGTTAYAGLLGFRIRDPDCVIVYDKVTQYFPEFRDPIESMVDDYDSLPGLNVMKKRLGQPLCGDGPGQRTEVHIRKYYSPQRTNTYAWATAKSSNGWCINQVTLKVTGKCGKEDPRTRPYYGNIAVNVALWPRYASNHERQKLVTHEMGHIMGMGHPFWWWWQNPCKDSVMVQGFSCYPLVYRLSAEDKDNLNALYPPLVP